jgi:serine/threonine protein kinase/tetratricopeptide (TPR) repeat protein
MKLKAFAGSAPDGYHIESTIGRGGMGIVYRARQAASGDVVALKVVDSLEPGKLLALRKEIAVLSRIRHSGVVRIIDHGLAGDAPWYAMEILHGRTLAELNAEHWREFEIAETEITTVSGALAQHDVPLDWVAGLPLHSAHGPTHRRVASDRPAAAGRLVDTLRIYQRLCEPLAHIHDQGIVHLDLNPKNLFVRTDGSTVLMDFGLWTNARGGIGRELLDAGRAGFGSINYVAPERILGRSVDARTDLYSLGCMLYESLVGSPPFAGSALADTLTRHLEAVPLAPSQVVFGVPVALDELVLSLLSKLPEQRMGRADDVAHVISSLLGDHTPPKVARSGSTLYRPRLAGRQQLLDELMIGWDAALSGDGRIVLLGGESGMGKTALANEMSQRAREWALTHQRKVDVVTGQCRSMAADGLPDGPPGGIALYPLNDLFHAVADRFVQNDRHPVQESLAEHLAVLAAYSDRLARLARARGLPAPTMLPASAGRDRAIRAGCEVIRAFACEAPLLLILDDLQWADDLTLGILQELARPTEQPLTFLVLGTFRDEEATPLLHALAISPRVRHLSVSPIDDKSAAHIIGDMLAMRQPPAALVEFTREQAAGNPFLIAEYLRLMVAEGILVREGSRWQLDAERMGGDAVLQSLPPPLAVRELVARRLSRLGPDARRFIQCASLLGRQFDPSVVAAVLSIDQSQAELSLQAATRADVVSESLANRFVFTHDQIRETAYRSVPPDELPGLHGAVARVIEQRHSGDADFALHFPALAHHYTRSRDHAGAVQYWDRAGQEAQKRSANREAITYFKKALEHHDTSSDVGGPKVARWLREVGDALQGLGDLPESGDYLMRSAAASGVPVPKTKVGLGLALMAQGLRQAAHRLAPRRFLESQQHDAERLLEAARAYDRLQQVYYYRGDAMRSLYAALRTLNLAEAAPPSPELVNAYANAHAVAGIVPARGLSRTYRDRARDAIQRVHDPASKTYFLLLAGGYHVGCAQFAEAQSAYEEGIPIAKGIGFRRRWEELTGAFGSMQFIQGRFDESMENATAQYESALRGDSQTQCWGLMGRAQVFLVWEQAEHALRATIRAEAFLGALGRPERIWVFGIQALAALHCQDRELAAASATKAAAEILAAPPVAWFCIEAHAAVAEVMLSLMSLEAHGRRPHRGRVGELVRSLVTLSRIWPVAASRHWLHAGWLHAIDGRSREARRAFINSLDDARRSGMRYEAARAQRALGMIGDLRDRPLDRPKLAVERAAGLRSTP